ncbi:MAG: SDR family NAD(P)-dependent oxidoreductase [Bradymonadaceae bacterium]|nr:SDR family NAD(P)-dependent oxidoreductase [Lujinxingiaceae bacterium]
MPRRIEEQVIVIIGASSGLGRQTALDLADEGASVVVASRNAPALEELATELEARGARRAVAHPMDISKTNEVETLVSSTIEQFGRIDTLMVMPGLAIYAPIEQTTLEEFERMIDVLLIGYVRAAKAILPVFRRQGYGTLINVASALGKGAVPLQGAYTSAKHGVVGFTQTLQMELRGSGINVCLVLPGSMATPLQPVHARSKTGRVPKAVVPVFHPRRVSKKLVRCAKRPRATIKPDPQSKLFIPLGYVASGLISRVLSRFGERMQMTHEPEPTHGRDNIDAPMLTAESASITGGALTTADRISRWTRFHPVRALLFAALASASLLVTGRKLAKLQLLPEQLTRNIGKRRGSNLLRLAKTSSVIRRTS